MQDDSTKNDDEQSEPTEEKPMTGYGSGVFMAAGPGKSTEDQANPPVTTPIDNVDTEEAKTQPEAPPTSGQSTSYPKSEENTENK